MILGITIAIGIILGAFIQMEGTRLIRQIREEGRRRKKARENT